MVATQLGEKEFPKALGLAIYVIGGSLLLAAILITFVFPRVSIGPQPLVLRGEITPEMLAMLPKVNARKISRVEVSSPGGDIETAIALARHFKQLKRPILIHGQCQSACINFLIIDGDVTVAEGTVVGLHQTGQSLAAVMRTAYPNISRWQREAAQVERDWFVENGVDPRLALVSQALVSPQCVNGPLEDRLENRWQISLNTKNFVWAPPLEIVERYGLKVKGRWQTDETLLRALFENSAPNTRPPNFEFVSFGPEPAAVQRMTYDEIFEMLAVPRCTREQPQIYRVPPAPVTLQP